MGLEESKHIGRILIDPDERRRRARRGDRVRCSVRAAIAASTRRPTAARRGSACSFVDDETGANDLVMAPSDPKTIYASTYQRRRTSCCVNGGGPGSGIWKSTTAATPGPDSPAAFPPDHSAASASTSIERIRNIVYAAIEGAGAARTRGGGDGRRALTRRWRRGGGGRAAVAAAVVVVAARGSGRDRSLSLRRRRRDVAVA